MPTNLNYTVTIYPDGHFTITDPGGTLLHEGLETSDKLAEKSARDWIKEHKSDRKEKRKAHEKRAPKRITVPY